MTLIKVTIFVLNPTLIALKLKILKQPAIMQD